ANPKSDLILRASYDDHVQIHRRCNYRPDDDVCGMTPRQAVIKVHCDSNKYSSGLECYQRCPPDIGKALSFFVSSLDDDFGAEQCNMIGRCLELTG
ncbi:MAG: hypothetical protein WCL16_13230, partial [bacterium]